MMIADHMQKKNIIPNSYSYTFIDQSVRNGRIENKEDHLVQPPTEKLRSGVHINGSARTTRTPFTQADDECLKRFMVKNRHRPRLGNVIFVELAALVSLIHLHLECRKLKSLERPTYTSVLARSMGQQVTAYN